MNAALLFLLLLLMPTLATAQTRLHTQIAASAGVAMHGLDLATTYRALGANPKAAEGNPIMRGLVAHPIAFGSLKMGTAVAIQAWLMHLQKTKPKAAFWIAVGQAVSVGYIAHRNNQIARKR